MDTAQAQFRTLGDARRSIVGDSDSFHYRTPSGRTIRTPVSKRHKSVWLCSENDRLGYRGIQRIDRHPGGGWNIADDASIFEQNSPRSFSAMFSDIAELGW